jgi:hypothetical protein
MGLKNERKKIKLLNTKNVKIGDALYNLTENICTRT